MSPGKVTHLGDYTRSKEWEELKPVIKGRWLEKMEEALEAQARGDYNEALERFFEALTHAMDYAECAGLAELSPSVTGLNLRHAAWVASTATHIGQLHLQRGDPDAAEPYLADALRLDETMYPKSDPERSKILPWVLELLAEVRRAQGREGKAFTLRRRASDIRKSGA
jgi:tetratricopeptide (TPR) repeat protein